MAGGGNRGPSRPGRGPAERQNPVPIRRSLPEINPLEIMHLLGRIAFPFGPESSSLSLRRAWGPTPRKEHTMTVNEMIERLQEAADDGFGECEVRLAFQPNWPLQYTVAGIATPDDESRAQGEPDEEPDDAASVVYLVGWWAGPLP